jgi:hypothetical protein
MQTREELLKHIQDERAQWQALVAEVGEARMQQPGPMGEWTFKDLVAHLLGWRELSIRRLEAGPGQEPPTPWPSQLTEDDEINDWIQAQSRDRPLRDVLDEADRSYERLAAAIGALPEADVTTAGRFAWLDGQALARWTCLVTCTRSTSHQSAPGWRGSDARLAPPSRLVRMHPLVEVALRAFEDHRVVL